VTYPKDIRENLLYRGEVLSMVEAELMLPGESRPRVLMMDIQERMCRDDILYWFNVFCWTYDPRTKEKHHPFVTWPFQDENILMLNEAMETAERGENAHIHQDKSRDMGATYMMLYVFQWRWLFKVAQQFRVGSRKEEYVDKKGDLDSHFEKLRYNLKRHPAWLLPQGLDWKKHVDTYMRMINPETDSVIVGEATNPNFARGGRKTAVLFDEFASWEMAEESWVSASDATNCKIALSTPKGAGNTFARLKRTDEVDLKSTLIWWKHPKKANLKTRERNRYIKEGLFAADQSDVPFGCFRHIDGKIKSPWYMQQERSRSPEDLAENVDIDYLTTGRPIFNSLVVSDEMGRALPPARVGDLTWRVTPRFDPRTGLVANADELSVELVDNPTGLWSIWEEPSDEYDDGYCLGADTAEGLDQGDYDVAVVGKRFGRELEVVCGLRAHLEIHRFAEELAKVGVYYQMAVENVERNQHGHGVIAHLIQMYPKVWHADVMTKGYAERSDRMGWDTNQISRSVMIGDLGKVIHERKWRNPWKTFWAEAQTFVDENGKMQAQGKGRGERCYDDTIIAHGIMLYTHQHMSLPTTRDKREPRTIYRWQRSEHQQSLVGWVI